MAAIKDKKSEKETVKETPKSNQRVELWAYDEYNQGSIIASGTDIEKLVARAQQYVTEANVENSLSAGEKDKAWEVFFPQILKGKAIDNSVIYAGNKRDGKHYVYAQKNGKWVQEELPTDTKFKFFLGNIKDGKVRNAPPKPWYLSAYDVKTKVESEVQAISNQLLERKTVLFLKVVG